MITVNSITINDFTVSLGDELRIVDGPDRKYYGRVGVVSLLDVKDYATPILLLIGDDYIWVKDSWVIREEPALVEFIVPSEDLEL